MSDRRSVVLDGSSLPPKALIGGKAWSIARMRQIALPVPPAFCLTTQLCQEFHAGGRTLPADVADMITQGVDLLEQETGRTFGGTEHPLLVSVRSGAAVSMPGMMDTVLNLGMNDEIERALARESGDPAYASDTHRRFLLQYARIVLRTRLYVDADADVATIRAHAQEEAGEPIPEDATQQLLRAVAAVFDSWNSPRAKAYRRHWEVEGAGTAVTVQAMVFGNLDDHSGTGVLFTRNPLTGDGEMYGEYLPRGQGEDVVSGEHDPLPLSALSEELPDVHDELLAAGRTLEQQAADAQDVEFTVQHGRLFLLQARTAKRSPDAAVRMAVDMVDEGLIDVDEALHRLTTDQVRTLLRPTLAPEVRDGATVLASGESACPGVASGVVVLDSDEAERRASEGEEVILARPTTSPDDVHGMISAQGVITELGGSTSHAAVVSRALGRPCVVGCGEGILQELADRPVSVDGTAGAIYDGILPTQQTTADEHPGLSRMLQWAIERSPLTVLFPDDPAVPEDTVDLDAHAVDDPTNIADALGGSTSARGSILATDDGVRAALAAGATTLVLRPRLPALLTALSPREVDPEPTSPHV
jgi:pyruvate, orthophosphate dikinase